MVAQAPDGGYELYLVNEEGRQSSRALKDGLPEDFAVDNLYLSPEGTLLLSVYVRSGVQLSEFAVYAAEQGADFQLLLSEPLEGTTADEKRRSASLVTAQADGTQLSFTLAQSGEYTRYAFDPQQEQGVQRVEVFSGTQAEEIASRRRQEVEKAWQLVQQAGLDATAVTGLSTGNTEGAVAILSESELYSISAEGAATDLSAGLYSPRWQSALILAAGLLIVLVLAYLCYYFICEANKLYFPLALRGFLLLCLAGYLAVNAAMTLLVTPLLSELARAEAQQGMNAQLQTVSGTQSEELTEAAKTLAASHPAYADITLYYLTDRQGEWAVEASSDPGWEEETAGILHTPSWAAQAFQKGQDAFTARYQASPCYFVCSARDEGGLLCMRLNAGALEAAQIPVLSMIRILAYCSALVIILLALLLLRGAAQGAKRAREGIDLIAQGAGGVQVVNPSGDELEALAAAVNDLSAQEEEKRGKERANSNTYLRFVPQRLVALLGVADIQQVNKTSVATHKMAVMAVRFVIPQADYQQGAQALFDDINQVFDYAVRPISAAGGAIYNFTYNGFDAVFDTGVKAAIGAAVALRQALLELNAQRSANRAKPVRLRVALDFGTTLIGVVGDDERVVPTVVSDCLNTAYRLADLAEVVDANILCTAPVADAAGEYALRYIGKCRGGRQGFRVYEIFDGDPLEIRQAKEGARAVFSQGVYAFYSGDFSGAKALFMEIARRPGEDGVARHYLYLADQYEKNRPEQIGLG